MIVAAAIMSAIEPGLTSTVSMPSSVRISSSFVGFSSSKCSSMLFTFFYNKVSLKKSFAYNNAVICELGLREGSSPSSKLTGISFEALKFMMRRYDTILLI